MRWIGLLVVACIAAGLVWLAVSPWPGSAVPVTRVVRVAAAADSRFALDDVTHAFHVQHPDVHVEVTYAASGNLLAQLCHRAPFDVFLAADAQYPHQLVERKLADAASEFVYAIGRLVVWIPRSSALPLEELGIEALLDPAVKRIAIANPRHAPYGRAAAQALQALGVYERVKEKLVLGDNVAQAAQFVESGAADAGVLALSLAMAPPLRDRGRYWKVPLHAYPRLEQGGVILSWAQDRDGAEALCAFLRGRAGRTILERYGFALPGE